MKDLSSEALDVSIWRGDIELNDMELKKDIFTTLQKPMDLIYGKIGYLRIKIPWRSLGSKPVEVEVRDVWIVVQPLTDSARWELVETLETSYEMKETIIREMAKTLFDELIKTEEEKKKEKGMTESLITKIVDNLQISLRNIHIRVEYENLKEPDDSFSLGLTLQNVDLQTTDENWEPTYIDRTEKKNKNIAMNKLLKVNNFGIYYKIGETNLIAKLEDDAHKIEQLIEFNQFDQDGRSLKQVEDYLIKPIRLEVKLTQNDPETAL